MQDIHYFSTALQSPVCKLYDELSRQKVYSTIEKEGLELSNSLDCLYLVGSIKPVGENAEIQPRQKNNRSWFGTESCEAYKSIRVKQIQQSSELKEKHFEVLSMHTPFVVYCLLICNVERDTNTQESIEVMIAAGEDGTLLWLYDI